MRLQRNAFLLRQGCHISVTTGTSGPIAAHILYVTMAIFNGPHNLFVHAGWLFVCRGYFSSNLEGVCKYVECTFEILKKRWHVLNDGFFHQEMEEVCEKICITCCWLNNLLLDLMERSNIKVGRGAPIDDDSIWLSGVMKDKDRTKADRCRRWRRVRRRLHSITTVFSGS